MPMKSHQQILFASLVALLVLAGIGLVLTGKRWDAAAGRKTGGAAQSLVDQRPLQTAQALAAFASTREEQEWARKALRLADHEVDLAFAMELRGAATQPASNDPETRALLARVDMAQKQLEAAKAEVAPFTKLIAGAREEEREGLSREHEFAKARLELAQEELDDAKEDLIRSGNDPQSRIERIVREHNSSEHAGGSAQPDPGVAGNPGGATAAPSSNSFFSRAREWYALRSEQFLLRRAQEEAAAAVVDLTRSHDEIEKQLEQLQEQVSQLTKRPAGAERNAAPASTPGRDDAASKLSSIRKLSSTHETMATLDKRIRDEQELAGIYGQWGEIVSSRQRDTIHGLLLSITWTLLIALAVLVFNRSLEHFFDRLAPDRRRLLTLRAVVRMAARAIGALMILLVLFGPPGQMAAVLALAGAGLTVALKDFIVGFFGWFVLMGKNGIRQGDWVEINGVSGEVVEIGLFRTVLLETGNWNDAGHPTGRRVTFINSYAIEGHYFNFSSHSHWPVVEKLK